MHLKFRNVNDAFAQLVRMFAMRSDEQMMQDHWPIKCNIVRRPSRVGEVLVIEEPVTVTYTNPRERVLFNAARDCNPFFHLYESLWMLAGREDIAPLSYYSSGYAKQVQDGDSPNANGAYGNRWRNWKVPKQMTIRQFDSVERGPDAWGRIDQLAVIADRLRADPNDRRCVLEMWSVHSDLLRAGGKCVECLGTGFHRYADKDGKPWFSDSAACGVCKGTARDPNGSKDVCCNTHAYFLLRKADAPGNMDIGDVIVPTGYFLDMTVCNRSNDLVWGMLGANVVHFSFLQEYLAARIGCEVGLYHQVTNNLHVYTERFKPDEWLADTTYPKKYTGLDEPWVYAQDKDNPQFVGAKTIHPLVRDPAVFDREVKDFVDRHRMDAFAGSYTEPFLRSVAQPMSIAFHHYKRDEMKNALSTIDLVDAPDWRIAGRRWLQRRAEKRSAVQGGRA